MHVAAYMSRQRRRQIHLTEIQACHLLCYENSLLPLLQCYLHANSDGQRAFKSPDALEKHIVQMFVQGKPNIAADYIVVTYRQEGQSIASENVDTVSKTTNQVFIELCLLSYI